MNIRFLENEYWYGGIVHMGPKLPISANDDVLVPLTDYNKAPDQSSPLFLSSKGRYIYGDREFNIYFKNGEIVIPDNVHIEIGEGFETLKGAQHAFAKTHFKLSGKTPELEFFEVPQYNTWIELITDQTSEKIYAYATSIIQSGLKPGIFMIDNGWQEDHGIFEFHKGKIPNPKKLIKSLHDMGFKVMLWVSPIVASAGTQYKMLRDKGYLVRASDGGVAIREWWDGFSAVLDLTNPEAVNWVDSQLEYLMNEYGVDGFKFDAGDQCMYSKDDKTYIQQEPCAHTKFFNEFCKKYDFNELRSVWDCGGEPLVCRLQDKFPKWDTRGLLSLVPNMLAQGIMGYYYGCPDMIGGGVDAAFLKEGFKIDEELYLRWLGASLLCPMMQFSISPKRILSDDGFKTVQKLLKIREKYSDTIINLAKNASVTGEPILRYMEYEFPGFGYEKLTNQFMLGENILVAPILEKGKEERNVYIPTGNWVDAKGECFVGPTVVEYKSKIDEVPVFQRDN